MRRMVKKEIVRICRLWNSKLNKVFFVCNSAHIADKESYENIDWIYDPESSWYEIGKSRIEEIQNKTLNFQVPVFYFIAVLTGNREKWTLTEVENLPL